MRSLTILFSTVILIFAACSTEGAVALDIGADAPDFELTSTTGTSVKLSELKGKVIVLEWFNYGCPFVRKHYDPKFMQQLQKDFGAKDIVWLTINSTHTDHRDFLDSEATNKLVAEKTIASTHVLLDPEGTVGKRYSAKTTPHLFIVDAAGKLAYQGAIDDAPDTSTDPTESLNYVQTGLTAILAGNTPSPAETKPYGCSVKYGS